MCRPPAAAHALSPPFGKNEQSITVCVCVRVCVCVCVCVCRCFLDRVVRESMSQVESPRSGENVGSITCESRSIWSCRAACFIGALIVFCRYDRGGEGERDGARRRHAVAPPEAHRRRAARRRDGRGGRRTSGRRNTRPHPPSGYSLPACTFLGTHAATDALQKRFICCAIPIYSHQTASSCEDWAQIAAINPRTGHQGENEFNSHSWTLLYSCQSKFTDSNQNLEWSSRNIFLLLRE